MGRTTRRFSARKSAANRADRPRSWAPPAGSVRCTVRVTGALARKGLLIRMFSQLSSGSRLPSCSQSVPKPGERRPGEPTPGAHGPWHDRQPLARSRLRLGRGTRRRIGRQFRQPFLSASGLAHAVTSALAARGLLTARTANATAACNVVRPLQIARTCACPERAQTEGRQLYPASARNRVRFNPRSTQPGVALSAQSWCAYDVTETPLRRAEQVRLAVAVIRAR